KRLAAFLVPEAPEGLRRLSDAGVPSFRTPEACADAIIAALRRHPPKPVVAGAAKPGGEGGRLLDELEAGNLLDRLGVARVPAIAMDADASRAPALPCAYPVAVKVLSAAIAHKTDLGGVVLGVKDEAGLFDAIAAIRRNVAARQPDTRVDRVLVQPMIAGHEALVGYRVDPDVGPLVIVAAGGIFTEVHRDRSLRLAPVDFAEAREMIAEVRMLDALAGRRGQAAADVA